MRKVVRTTTAKSHHTRECPDQFGYRGLNLARRAREVRGESWWWTGRAALPTVHGDRGGRWSAAGQLLVNRAMNEARISALVASTVVTTSRRSATSGAGAANSRT